MLEAIHLNSCYCSIYSLGWAVKNLHNILFSLEHWPFEESKGSYYFFILSLLLLSLVTIFQTIASTLDSCVLQSQSNFFRWRKFLYWEVTGWWFLLVRNQKFGSIMILRSQFYSWVLKPLAEGFEDSTERIHVELGLFVERLFIVLMSLASKTYWAPKKSLIALDLDE